MRAGANDLRPGTLIASAASLPAGHNPNSHQGEAGDQCTPFNTLHATAEGGSRAYILANRLVDGTPIQVRFVGKSAYPRS
jgi:hypothetical protein